MFKLIIFVLACQTTFAARCFLDVLYNFPNNPLITVNNKLQKPPSKLQKIEDLMVGNKIMIDDDFTIVCPEKSTPATCIDGSNIETVGKVDFVTVKCRDSIDKLQLVVKEQEESCSLDHTLYDIGYKEISDVVYKVCFDNTNLRPFYSTHTLTKWTRTYTLRDAPMESFLSNMPDKAKLYGTINMQALYENIKSKWLPANLTSNFDFFYPQETLATWDYINTAVQNGHIARGNWATLERALRSLTSSDVYKELIIYTGTLNVLKINGVEMYLDTANKKIPYPEWFWKIAYDPTSLKGVVVFIYNNVEKDKNLVEASFKKLCSTTTEFYEVQSLYSIVPYDPNKGITYACSFKSVIDQKIQNILKGLTNDLTNIDYIY